MKVGPRKDMVSSNNCFAGKESAGDLFSRGYYHIGINKIEDVMDKIRKQVEKCESFEGFLTFHSVGGGTGSGLGSKIL